MTAEEGTTAVVFSSFRSLPNGLWLPGSGRLPGAAGRLIGDPREQTD